MAADTSKIFVLDVGCSHGYLQPEKGAVCPYLASSVISWEKVASLASSLLWLPMLWLCDILRKEEDISQLYLSLPLAL